MVMGGLFFSSTDEGNTESSFRRAIVWQLTVTACAENLN